MSQLGIASLLYLKRHRIGCAFAYKKPDPGKSKQIVSKSDQTLASRRLNQASRKSRIFKYDRALA